MTPRVKGAIAVFTAVLGAACRPYGPVRVGALAKTYQVYVTQVSPKPGTPLEVGDVVRFTITVAYSFTETDSGRVVLVPQDEREGRLHPERPQVSVGVTRGSGVVTLTDSIAVPRGIREVQLFILLAPARAGSVQGEVVVRYPVRSSS